MFKSYLNIAWRNVIRHKIHTAINVIGLTLGITCCLFIFLWVHDEQRVDNFNADGKNIYSVFINYASGGKINSTYTTPIKYSPVKNAIVLGDVDQAVPGIKNMAFYATGYDLPWGHPETIRVGEKIMKLDGSRASENFFKIFSYPLIKGDANTALKNITGIAISRKMANEFFGSPVAAMGKTVRYENKINFAVSAVFEDLPAASSMHFEFLLNWDAQMKGLEWSSNDFQTYVQLSPTANVAGVAGKMTQLLQARTDKQAGLTTQVGLQLVSDRYLHSIFVNGTPSDGRIQYVRIFSGVAIFILIIACINFMNLATARAVKRAKEIGLRKVVGSTRAQLIGQFFCEALFFAFLAMLLSMVLLIILLPSFNQFTGKQIALPVANVQFWLALIGLTFVTGIIAGSYPALYLSALKPVKIIKGVMRFTPGTILFRKGLTVFQFMLSIMLIIATIVISRQMTYVENTHLGYDRSNLLYVRIEGELAKKDKYLLFKQEAMNLPGVALVDRASEAPHAMSFVVTDPVNWQGKDKNASVGFKPTSVGLDFLKIMNLQVASGRGFSRGFATDSTDAFMVNEKAVKEMGMKNPIGQWVSAWKKRGHIIGILKDYHTQSLREPIMPVIMDVKEYENFGLVIIRTKAGQTKQAIDNLSKLYSDINPDYPFAYQFVDEEYKKLYTSETVVSKLSVLFATLAILISCLGLLGLVMFAAEQRIKEISIRKVMGASLTQIIALFSKDFLKLVMIAFFIAAPIAWLSMNQWLQSFAYRVPISWWIFALAGLSSVTIALLTVSYQAVKAASANPVKTLRSE